MAMCLIASVLALPGAARAQEPIPARPNVVIISIDDLKSVLGFQERHVENFLATIYKDPETRSQVRQLLSPNIDRLAAQSVVFDDAHTVYPICNPSRIALWTGTRPNDTGLDSNTNANFRGIPGGRNLVTLQQHLRDDGYFTTGLGKVFHSPRGGTDNELSWDTWIDRPHGAKGPWTHNRYSSRSFKFPFGASRYGLDEQHDIVNAEHAARLAQFGTSTITNASGADITVSLPENDPFLISLGIYLPHSPFVAPTELLDLFPVDQMDLDRADLDAIYADLGDLSSTGEFYSNSRNGRLGGSFQQILKRGDRLDRTDGDLNAWKEVVRHYLASVAVADRSVGRVLDAIDAGPYRDNTVVVLHTDHGYNLGEKNIIAKNHLWDDATRSVMMFRAPGVEPSIVDETVHLQDIYPTVAALTGNPAPSYVSYEDLTPFFENPDHTSSKPILSVQGRRRNKRYAVITEEFRYLRFGTAAANREMYSRSRDPLERTNLINDEAYTDVVSALDTAMDQLLENDDAPPVLLPLQPLEWTIGQQVSGTVTGLHVHGEQLAYSASGLPDGVTMNPTTGALTGSATKSGTFSPVVTVSSPTMESTMSIVVTVSESDDTTPTTSTVAPPMTTTTVADSTTTEFAPTTTTLPVATTTTTSTTASPPSTTTTITGGVETLGPRTISAESLRVTEGAGNRNISVVFTADRPSDSSIRIHYRTVNGTAIRNRDFRFRSSSVLLPAGQTQVAANVLLIGDSRAEETETFTIDLFRVSRASEAKPVLASGVITIVDDD